MNGANGFLLWKTHVDRRCGELGDSFAVCEITGGNHFRGAARSPEGGAIPLALFREHDSANEHAQRAPVPID
jgi:hypothetical protein